MTTFARVCTRQAEIQARHFRTTGCVMDRNRAYAQAQKEIEASDLAARAEAADQERGEQSTLRNLLATTGPHADVYRRIVESIAREHDIAIEWRDPSQMPAGASAYAELSRRRIVVPHIAGSPQELDSRFAVCLHEIGHVVSEPCRGGVHQRNPSVREWWHCLECERLAWRAALALWDFSRDMFDRLRASLGWYLSRTPGSPEAIAAVEMQRGSVTFARHRQQRLGRSVEGARARLAWALLSPSEQLDREIANPRARREAMRVRKGRYAF